MASGYIRLLSSLLSREEERSDPQAIENFNQYLEHEVVTRGNDIVCQHNGTSWQIIIIIMILIMIIVRTHWLSGNYKHFLEVYPSKRCSQQSQTMCSKDLLWVCCKVFICLLGIFCRDCNLLILILLIRKLISPLCHFPFYEFHQTEVIILVGKLSWMFRKKR